MFTKWTKREVLTFVICFVALFALVLATQLPGFLSPLYWAMFPVLSAFVAAGPLTCVMSMKRGFGSAAVLPSLWLIVYKLIGEMGMTLMWVGALALIVLAELVHMLLGPGKPVSIRISAVIAALVPSAAIWPLYFQKAVFLKAAAEEGMSAAYVTGLDQYGSIGVFVLMIVLSCVTATLSERISEKITHLDTSSAA